MINVSITEILSVLGLHKYITKQSEVYTETKGSPDKDLRVCVGVNMGVHIPLLIIDREVFRSCVHIDD